MSRSRLLWVVGDPAIPTCARAEWTAVVDAHVARVGAGAVVTAGQDGVEAYALERAAAAGLAGVRVCADGNRRESGRSDRSWFFREAPWEARGPTFQDWALGLACCATNATGAGWETYGLVVTVKDRAPPLAAAVCRAADRHGALPYEAHAVDPARYAPKRTALLVCGSRSFAGGPHAFWAGLELDELLEHLGSGDVVLAGGATGPDTWAVERARERGIRTLELRLDGWRYVDGVRERRWLPDGVRAHPLARNDALVAALVAASERGYDVAAVGLVDPASPTRGTGYTLDRARAAGAHAEVRTPPGAAAAAQAADGPPPEDGMVFLDLETSGRSPERHAILEIGFVVTDARAERELSRWESRVALPAWAACEPIALEIAGYDPIAWLAAPPLEQALPAALARLPRRFTLAAHNAPFDQGFVRAACRRLGLAEPGWRPRAADTARLARALLVARGATPDARLATVCDHYGVSNAGAHGALADAERCWRVYQRLVREGLAAAGGGTP